MSKLKRVIGILLSAVIIVAMVMSISACSKKYSMEPGTYTGSYKSHYHSSYIKAGFGPFAKDEEIVSDHWGIKVTFEVDDDGKIWNLENEACEADEASGEAGYTSFSNSKFNIQFSGLCTIDELMNITVKVNDKGFPEGEGCIDDKGLNLTIVKDCDAQCALIILAIQEAIKNPTKATAKA